VGGDGGLGIVGNCSGAWFWHIGYLLEGVAL
jgi:hypothetical protein